MEDERPRLPLPWERAQGRDPAGRDGQWCAAAGASEGAERVEQEVAPRGAAYVPWQRHAAGTKRFAVPHRPGNVSLSVFVSCFHRSYGTRRGLLPLWEP